MNKHGYIFSIITILMLLSLSFLAYSAINKVKAFGMISSESFISSKLNFIESDIASDYISIIGVDLLNITRDSEANEIILEFDHLGNIPRSLTGNRLTNFKDFIENTFSRLITTNITLSNLDTNMTFVPYNTTFNFIDNSTVLDIYTQDYANIKKIYVELSLDKNFTNENCPDNNNPSDPEVHVKMLYNETPLLDCTRNREVGPSNCGQSKFSASQLSDSADVYFCDPTGVPGNPQAPGTLRIESDEVNIEITHFTYIYNLIDEKTSLESDGKIRLDPMIGDILKESSGILLAEEGYHKFISRPKADADCLLINISNACVHDKELKQIIVHNTCVNTVYISETTPSWSIAPQNNLIGVVKIAGQEVWKHNCNQGNWVCSPVGKQPSGTPLEFGSRDVTLIGNSNLPIDKYEWDDDIGDSSFTIVLTLSDGSTKSSGQFTPPEC
jgi:hypothetical protein